MDDYYLSGIILLSGMNENTGPSHKPKSMVPAVSEKILYYATSMITLSFRTRNYFRPCVASQIFAKQFTVVGGIFALVSVSAMLQANKVIFDTNPFSMAVTLRFDNNKFCVPICNPRSFCSIDWAVTSLCTPVLFAPPWHIMKRLSRPLGEHA